MASKRKYKRRYFLLFIGLLVNAFGIVLITKSCLGTSPIASIPYVLSEYFSISMGTFTFLLYVLMFLVQALVLRKNMTRRDWLQIPLSIIYALFIDLSLSMVSTFQPSNYGIMLGGVLIGIVCRALGVSMQVVANVAMLSSEAFTVVLAKAWKKDLGIVKLITDVLMTILAVILSWMLLGHIVGVREGTLIVTLLVAPLVNIFNRIILNWTDGYLSGRQGLSSLAHPGKWNTEDLIITISSQSGSGGHRIGKILSEKLNLPLYDNNLIDLIAEEGDFTKGYVSDHMGRLYTNRFWEFFAENYSYSGLQVDGYEDLFIAQKKVIGEIAGKGSCIIVGYCSEYLLREHPEVFSIYIHANEAAKLSFLKQEYQVTSEKAREIMRSHDRDRALYFKHFTGEEWSESERYRMSIDSSVFGIDGTAEAICEVIKKLSKYKTQIESEKK